MKHNPWVPTLLLVLPIVSALAFASEPPTRVITITKDDVANTPLGQIVKEKNDRLRKIADETQKLEKGSDLYNIGKNLFDQVKQERDEVGKPLRGLRGLQIVLYGTARSSPDKFKNTVIERYTASSDWKENIIDRTVHGFFSGRSANVDFPHITFTSPITENKMPEISVQEVASDEPSSFSPDVSHRCRWDWEGGDPGSLLAGHLKKYCQCYDDQGRPYLGDPAQCQ